MDVSTITLLDLMALSMNYVCSSNAKPFSTPMPNFAVCKVYISVERGCRRFVVRSRAELRGAASCSFMLWTHASRNFCARIQYKSLNISRIYKSIIVDKTARHMTSFPAKCSALHVAYKLPVYRFDPLDLLPLAFSVYLVLCALLLTLILAY